MKSFLKSNYLYKALTLIRHCVVFFRFGASGSSGSFEVGTSSKTSSLAAVTGGNFTMIVSVGILQCEFKVYTFCRANSKILPSYHYVFVPGSITNYWGKLCLDESLMVTRLCTICFFS